jgi:hypothetical protein
MPEVTPAPVVAPAAPATPAAPAPAVGAFKDFQSPHEASIDQLIQALDRAYHRPRLLMWRSFLQGIMTGIGASVGTLLVAGVITYSIHALGGIKLIQPMIDKLQESIVNSQIQASNKIQQQIQAQNQ